MPMYDIETPDPSDDFLACWKAAGTHLDSQVQDGITSWLRVHPYPPYLEHLSFRLGNQLFFIRIQDVQERAEIPGSVRGLLAVADGCKGHACVLPMVRKGRQWVPVHRGWGLVDARTGKPVDPVSLVTDEKIEMTPWELQDLAVQVVRQHLEGQKYKLMSWQGNPAVDPSIWCVGDSKEPEWVVVRATRYPEKVPARPANWRAIAEHCRSAIGHFAPVAVASADQPFLSSGEDPVPLWRGHGMHIRYEGLK